MVLEPEVAPAFRRRLRVNGAVLSFDRAARDREAEPGARLSGVRALERLEDDAQLLR
jgi:hypothetical protein